MSPRVWPLNTVWVLLCPPAASTKLSTMYGIELCCYKYFQWKQLYNWYIVAKTSPHLILSSHKKYMFSAYLVCHRGDAVLRRESPWGRRGFKSRIRPPYPQRDRKRRLNGAVCRNHRIKRVVPCRCLDWHVKEPYEMSMALGARP